MDNLLVTNFKQKYMELHKCELQLTDDACLIIEELGKIGRGEEYLLILSGGFGTSKTSLCRTFMAIYNEYKDINIKFFTSKEFANFVKKDYDNFEYIKDTPLIIDDIGIEQSAVKDFGNIAEPVYDLIHYRADRTIPLIISTNIELEGLVCKYDGFRMENGKPVAIHGRISDRLKCFNYVKLTGKSMRGGAK